MKSGMVSDVTYEYGCRTYDDILWMICDVHDIVGICYDQPKLRINQVCQ